MAPCHAALFVYSVTDPFAVAANAATSTDTESRCGCVTASFSWVQSSRANVACQHQTPRSAADSCEKSCAKCTCASHQTGLNHTGCGPSVTPPVSAVFLPCPQQHSPPSS